MYYKPKTINEVKTILSDVKDDFRFLAGGTDVMVNKYQGNDDKSCIIDLSGLNEIKGINEIDDFIKIGAYTSLHEIGKDPRIKNHLPGLAEAVGYVASPLIRYTATLGGNLLCENRCIFYNQSEWWREAVGRCLKCNGDVCIATGGKKACFSKFVSDLAPVLICLDARLVLIEPEGEKLVSLDSIYSGNGITPRNISPSTIIKEIIIPKGRIKSMAFRKLRHRQSIEFTSLTVAVSLDHSDKIRIALSGVDAGPVVMEAECGANYEELIAKVSKKPKVVDNDMYSREYRKSMIVVYLRSCFKQLELV